MGINNIELKKDPMDPDIVFLGLIFVNFFPLKVLPTNNPPISDDIEIRSEYTISSFKFGSLISTVIIRTVKKDTYNNERLLYKNLKKICFKFFFKKILEIKE